MLKLRINPVVVNDLKGIYEKFENIQMFPEIGIDLSRRVSFRTVV